MKTFFFLSLFCITCVVPAFSHCLDDQKSLLLGLRNSLTFNLSASRKLAHWNYTKDCCKWTGIECDVFGHVTILQLDEETISGGIENSEYLFNLTYLEKLNLGANNLSGSLPNFISNLTRLSRLELSNCNFSGPIPPTIGDLTELAYLDISDNNFNGSLPQFHLSKKLTHIVAFGNSLIGSLSSMHFEGLLNLEYVDLRYNSLSGNIPSSLFALPSLKKLYLANNEFHGQVQELANMSASSLVELDVSFNHLEGPIPKFFFKLEQLRTLSLSSNKFNGTVKLEMFKNPSLETLDMSHNDLFIQSTDSDSNLPLLNLASSKLRTLDLSSNQLKGEIPNWIWEIGNGSLEYLNLSHNLFHGFQKPYKFSSLSQQSRLNTLDLSSNQLKGEIPNWIWEIGNGSLNHVKPSHNLLDGFQKPYNFSSLSQQSRLDALGLSSNQLIGEVPDLSWGIGNNSLQYLNLSHNLLNGFQKPCKFPSLIFLDLHSNQLQGELPIPPLSSFYVDYSYNYFTNTIPNDIGVFLSEAVFFSVSNNNLIGEIPSSICSATFLKVLDLSANSLTGSIPPCLPNNSDMEVLSLGRNNLNGTIPDTFSLNCSMRTLDINKNVLEGKIPRSLVNCPVLGVLDLGNNRFEDTFPCMLMKTTLRVLILRSNKLYGDLQCFGAIQELLNLQIIDISSNKFDGDISLLSFSKWTGMMNADHNKQLQYNHLRFYFFELLGYYYQDAVSVTMKGQKMELTEIFFAFTFIDFSNNKFRGEIPYSIGDLKSLYGLNLSHNELTGSIPTSIGNLTQLESLDLSVNKLSGKIPVELVSLTFISFLNLSYNILFGKIPEGHQLQTFSATSFEGNIGLYGCPIDISCDKKWSGGSIPGSQNGEAHLKEMDGDYVSAALGFAVGFGSIVWLLLHCERWKKMYFGKIDQILLKLVHKC